MYKILDNCSALVRKCIEGLDNFVMEGCRAFDELNMVLDQMHGDGDMKFWREGLQNSKRYLKSGLKVKNSM